MSWSDELVLTRFAAIDMIVGVEERSIWKHPRHFPSLVHNKESCVFVNFLDFNHFVVLWHNFVLMMEELDKLLRGHSIGDDFQHCKGWITVPSLVHDQWAIFVFVNDGHLVAIWKYVSSEIQQLLLDPDSAFKSIFEALHLLKIYSLISREKNKLILY